MVVVSKKKPQKTPKNKNNNNNKIPRDVEYKENDSFDVLNVDLTLSDEWKVEWLTISYFVHQSAVS